MLNLSMRTLLCFYPIFYTILLNLYCFFQMLNGLRFPFSSSDIFIMPLPACVSYFNIGTCLKFSGNYDSSDLNLRTLDLIISHFCSFFNIDISQTVNTNFQHSTTCVLSLSLSLYQFNAHTLSLSFSHLYIQSNSFILGQWLWRSWQSSCFQYQRTRVRIQSSATFIEHLFTFNYL